MALTFWNSLKVLMYFILFFFGEVKFLQILGSNRRGDIVDDQSFRSRRDYYHTHYDKGDRHRNENDPESYCGPIPSDTALLSSIRYISDWRRDLRIFAKSWDYLQSPFSKYTESWNLSSAFSSLWCNNQAAEDTKTIYPIATFNNFSTSLEELRVELRESYAELCTSLASFVQVCPSFTNKSMENKLKRWLNYIATKSASLAELLVATIVPDPSLFGDISFSDNSEIANQTSKKQEACRALDINNIIADERLMELEQLANVTDDEQSFSCRRKRGLVDPESCLSIEALFGCITLLSQLGNLALSSCGMILKAGLSHISFGAVANFSGRVAAALDDEFTCPSIVFKKLQPLDDIHAGLDLIAQKLENVVAQNASIIECSGLRCTNIYGDEIFGLPDANDSVAVSVQSAVAHALWFPATSTVRDLERVIEEWNKLKRYISSHDMASLGLPFDFLDRDLHTFDSAANTVEQHAMSYYGRIRNSPFIRRGPSDETTTYPEITRANLTTSCRSFETASKKLIHSLRSLSENNTTEDATSSGISQNRLALAWALIYARLHIILSGNLWCSMPPRTKKEDLARSTQLVSTMVQRHFDCMFWKTSRPEHKDCEIRDAQSCAVMAVETKSLSQRLRWGMVVFYVGVDHIYVQNTLLRKPPWVFRFALDSGPADVAESAFLIEGNIVPTLEGEYWSPNAYVGNCGQILLHITHEDASPQPIYQVSAFGEVIGSLSPNNKNYSYCHFASRASEEGLLFAQCANFGSESCDSTFVIFDKHHQPIADAVKSSSMAYRDSSRIHSCERREDCDERNRLNQQSGNCSDASQRKLYYSSLIAPVGKGKVAVSLDPFVVEKRQKSGQRQYFRRLSYRIISEDLFFTGGQLNESQVIEYSQDFTETDVGIWSYLMRHSRSIESDDKGNIFLTLFTARKVVSEKDAMKCKMFLVNAELHVFDRNNIYRGNLTRFFENYSPVEINCEDLYDVNPRYFKLHSLFLQHGWAYLETLSNYNPTMIQQQKVKYISN